MDVLRVRNGKNQPWPSKPRINRDHPLAKGLIGCYLPGVLKGMALIGPNLANGSGGSGSRVVDPEGQALKSNSALSNRGLIAPAPALFTGSALSFYWRGVVFGACDPYSTLAGVTYDSASNSPFSAFTIKCEAGAGDYAHLGLEWNNAGSANASSSIIDFTPNYGNMVGLTATFKAGGNAILYLNGVDQGISTTFGASAPSVASPQIIINQFVSGFETAPNAACNLTFFWNRELSPSEIRQLDADPYCFLIYPEDELLEVLFRQSAGVTGPTITGLQLTASAGSVTERTDDSSTLTGLQLTSAAGSVTETFSANITIAGIQLTSAAGSVTEQTDDSSTLIGQQLTASAGSITETFTVNISISGLQLTSAAGSVVASGGTSINISGLQLTASAGSNTETFSANISIIGQQLTASAGTVTETFSANISITGQQLTASTGTVTTSGGTIVNVTGQQLTASAGSVTGRTDDSATLTGQQLTASAGTVTETSGTVVNITGLQLASAAGSISETFTANISIVGVQLAASAGSILAAISDSATLTGLQLASAAGSISEAVDDTTVLSGQQLTASAGTVSPSGTISTSFSIGGLQLTASFGLVSLSISGAIFSRSQNYITTANEIRRITAKSEIRRI